MKADEGKEGNGNDFAEGLVAVLSRARRGKYHLCTRSRSACVGEEQIFKLNAEAIVRAEVRECPSCLARRNAVQRAMTMKRTTFTLNAKSNGLIVVVYLAVRLNRFG